MSRRAIISGKGRLEERERQVPISAFDQVRPSFQRSTSPSNQKRSAPVSVDCQTPESATDCQPPHHRTGRALRDLRHTTPPSPRDIQSLSDSGQLFMMVDDGRSARMLVRASVRVELCATHSHLWFRFRFRGLVVLSFGNVRPFMSFQVLEAFKLRHSLRTPLKSI